uniref:Uncharacterized protein n=1 Tax=Chromera velia CCMP2878 TaxID=1169474 RepID=A0A0G4HJW4_9ALVE|eukprot:Cvel_28280.t1-p1 / transcript=Cvel_28280.t1 / gene=Cvel_28280 / organism=Chromera_velia_CCMP2878 / gene_product=Coatomer subunit beta'-1, putative / transcript_product=Coatomer subunit beta'-1, putative / location=Cvel_scaffold3666:3283-8752(+) / protein_length=157 / sequence_SO=supercontig / SO=protein_coding / is_pseudo=false
MPDVRYLTFIIEFLQEAIRDANETLRRPAPPVLMPEEREKLTVRINKVEEYLGDALFPQKADGNAVLWDYNTQSMIKSIEVSSLPLRCAKFIVGKQWIIAGCDDMQIRVYNYNTLEKVKAFDAHSYNIRHIAVHPNLPLFLTASDDMTEKLWDWEKG